MEQLLTVKDMRNSDARTIAESTPSRELMMRAAVGLYHNLPAQSAVDILCGTGNNAGDGYALATLLAADSFPCRLILTSDTFSEDGMYYFRKCETLPSVQIIHLSEIHESFDSLFTDTSVIVDCLYGTGFHGDITDAGIISLIEAANRSNAYLLSCDINSGLNGSNGLASSAHICSDLTVSIGSYQPGHFLNCAKDCMKEKTNVDIGIRPIPEAEPIFYADITDFAELFPTRKNLSNKSDYGYIALCGGSLEYSGAIRLASMANTSMRCGAGVVFIGAPKSICPAIIPQILESTIYPISDEDGSFCFVESEWSALCERSGVIAFGMGLKASDGARECLRYLLSHYTKTLIIDATGLTLLSQIPVSEIRRHTCEELILTPHLKEFSVLTGHPIPEIMANEISAAKEYSRATNAKILLKGPATLITDGTITYITDSGCPGMATAGSGDVLSGILAAILGAKSNRKKGLKAAACAACINGLAGEAAQKKLGAVSMIASDTIRMLPEILQSFFPLE